MDPRFAAGATARGAGGPNARLLTGKEQAENSRCHVVKYLVPLYLCDQKGAQGMHFSRLEQTRHKALIMLRSGLIPA
jgi:hypothetical protein